MSVAEEASEVPATWLARVAAAPGTAGLMASCAAIFVTMLLRCSARAGWAALWPESLWNLQSCSAELAGFGALQLARVWLDHEMWRVATAGLLHGSWLHLILNIWSLWVVGWWVERVWGTSRLLLVFGAGSLGGCVASLAWAEAPVVVGASAGILAIAGALWVGRGFGSAHVRARLQPVSARALGVMIVVLLALGAVVPVIAQAGHIGGLVVGLVLGWGWAESGARGRAGLAYATTASLLVAGLVAGRAPTWRVEYEEFKGYAWLERGQETEAVEAFSRALKARPGDPVLANAVAYGLAEAGVELERAELLVQIALDDEPTNPDYVDTLGWIQCRRGEVELGEGTLRRAMELGGAGVEEIEGHLRDCATAGE